MRIRSKIKNYFLYFDVDRLYLQDGVDKFIFYLTPGIRFRSCYDQSGMFHEEPSVVISCFWFIWVVSFRIIKVTHVEELKYYKMLL